MDLTLSPMRYRKRPVVIEALRHDGHPMTADTIVHWIEGHGHQASTVALSPLRTQLAVRIRTLEGDMTAGAGDWVIRGVQGEFYPVKDQIFRETYEAVG